jgi:hypothetical protein
LPRNRGLALIIVKANAVADSEEASAGSRLIERATRRWDERELRGDQSFSSGFFGWTYQSSSFTVPSGGAYVWLYATAYHNTVTSYPDLNCGQMLHNFGIRQRIVAHRRGIHSQVFDIRLLRSLDKLLRDKPRYRGELSSAVHDVLAAVDLNTVELIHLQRGHNAIAKETQMLPRKLKTARRGTHPALCGVAAIS